MPQPYALSDNGKWGHYDDSRVSTDIDPKEVVSNAAYVLYYKRRDVEFETPEFEPPLPAIVQDHMDRTPSATLQILCLWTLWISMMIEQLLEALQVPTRPPLPWLA